MTQVTGRDVYIGGTSAWSNPFVTGHDGDRETAAHRFAQWLPRNHDMVRLARRTLAGRPLVCGAGADSSHQSILAQLANDPTISTEDPVLVFGSNLGAIHGRGAAKFAAAHRGAARDVCEGLSGHSYAIPTKSASLATLHIGQIRQSVERFIDYAGANPDTLFDVTRVGCGLAGMLDEDVAPLFAKAPSNCRLPYHWSRLLDPGLAPRIIIAGSRDITHESFPAGQIDRLLGKLDQAPEIVSGAAKGVDQLGERFAIDRNLPFLRVPADWDRYKKAAGFIRNQHMSFLASHLVAVWNGQSPGTRGMIETARADRLQVRVVRV